MKKVVFVSLFLFMSLFASLTFKISANEAKHIIFVSEDQPFSTNSIIVIMQHNASMTKKNYTIEDFSEIMPNKIVDNDPYTYELIVKYLDGENVDLSKERIDAFRRSLTLKWNNEKTKSEIIEAIHLLELREDIHCVQPDYLYEPQSTLPNDLEVSCFSYYQMVNASNAWDYTTGCHSIMVGVIDSGIDGTHPDLTANLNNNLHKDFTSLNEQPLVDNYGHGTCVSGVIGAKGNNGFGISGICWDVSLVSLKAYDWINGTGDPYINSSLVAAAVNYANNNSIKILNFSWHLKDVYNNPVDDYNLYSALSNYNGLFVCSAGNCDGAIGQGTYNDSDYDNDLHPVYPANYSTSLSNVISVGGLENNNYPTRSIYSHYGENSVTLFANYYSYSTTITSDRYYYFNGTSAAAPMVAGAIALIYSINKNLSVSDVKTILLNTCSNVNIYTNIHLHNSNIENDVYIGKRLNIGAAILSALNSIVTNLNTHIIQNTSYNNFSESSLLSNNNSSYMNKKFYKLNVIDDATYQFRIDNSCTTNVTLYDANLSKIVTHNCNSIDQVRIFKTLNNGIYYVKVETNSNYTDNSLLTINREFDYYLACNVLNQFTNYNIDDYNYCYIHLQNSGYYSIAFVPLDQFHNQIYDVPSGMLELYSNDERSNLLASTTETNNIINIYLDYGVTYYFDIETNISDLKYFDILISPVS